VHTEHAIRRVPGARTGIGIVASLAMALSHRRGPVPQPPVRL